MAINQVEQYGTSYTDLDIKLKGTEEEEKLLDKFGVPIPGKDGKRTRDLLKRCFASHGDFFREVGVPNFRTFQPDWQYFESQSSNGWRKFMSRLVTEDDREETLKRAANVLLNKLGLLTHKAKGITIDRDLKEQSMPVDVNINDLTDKSMELRVGNKIFTVSKIEEAAKDTTLIDRAVKNLGAKAEGVVKQYGDEYANSLKLVRSQYEEELKKMGDQLKMKMPMLRLPQTLLQAGIMVNAEDGRYVFYIPIHLHYQYISSQRHTWTLKKQYQLEQDGYLIIAVDSEFNLCSSKLRDTHFQDTLELWHSPGGGVCWGSYKFSMKKVDDLIRIKDEVSRLFSTINLKSPSRRNIGSKQGKSIDKARNDAKFIKFPDGKEDLDLSSIATLQEGDVVENKKKKTKGGGRIWTS